MKILVWKSYGDINVYAAETPAQMISIIKTMIKCVDGWDLDDGCELARGHIAKYPDNMIELRKAFNTMRNAVEPGSHESFEDIFITDVCEVCQ
jgi:hypothetical protein